jgi:hypothetical protein
MGKGGNGNGDGSKLGYEDMTVQSILRSEILDDKTCEVCADTLDGIVLAADDPAWGGEMGMLAHPNCRMVLVPLFEGIEPVMEPSPPELIRQAVRHFNTIMPDWWVDRQVIPTRGRDALRNVPLTLRDISSITEDDELITRIFGWEE